MESIKLDKITKELDTFISERDWDQFHSIKNLSMALSVECSELVEIFQWLKEEESNSVATNSKLQLKVKEEIADIFVYLIQIARKSNIDIESAVLEKIKKNAEKYPVDKSKGISKKYDDL